MATSRGQMYQNLLRTLERLGPGRGPGGGPGAAGGDGPGGAAAGPGRGGGRSGKRWPAAPGRSAARSPEGITLTEKYKSAPNETSGKKSKENLLGRLPSEVLLRILGFLDASSLLRLGCVSKLFHRLANDDVIWQKLYMSEFGSSIWRPKAPQEEVKQEVREEERKQEVQPEVSEEEAESRSSGHWKKMFFKTMAGQEVNKWAKELTAVSPFTGLPRQTEWILRSLNVSWQLKVRQRLGGETLLLQQDVYFLESSVILQWSGGALPAYPHILNIQLHAVRTHKQQQQQQQQRQQRGRRPCWSSLVVEVNPWSERSEVIGRGRLVSLHRLPHGFVLGLYRGQTSSLAFIMVCLHYHKLVERSLLGTPAWPYSQPADPSPPGAADPPPGLHGYSLHFVLHNTDTQIMSAHFPQLTCRPVPRCPGRLRLQVVCRSDVSQHRSLSGNFRLCWQGDGLNGWVENCCLMTLTLLDGALTPRWWLSEAVGLRLVLPDRRSPDYGGQHFLLERHQQHGAVTIKLVWLKETQQFFLISFVLHVPASRVRH